MLCTACVSVSNNSLHLSDFCETMFSQSRSNKTLSHSEKIYIFNLWIERKLTGQLQGIMAFNESPIVNQWSPLMEKAKPQENFLNVEDFDSTNGTDSLPALIKVYETKDIFNANETGGFYTQYLKGARSFENSHTSACKMAKERGSLLCASNMNRSEKLKPHTIGKG
ncbi:hypothetical protein RF11_05463 [Thelohanellus kitauei]|uniref:Uncharacterized protein n=1 Tax=Thelohanellus kitauei TaxID=669202 RepID=A0A0C2NC13_THEKT|nr:hypothetical protein RF11_05463 [Thelohanellus kitauei]